MRAALVVYKREKSFTYAGCIPTMKRKLMQRHAPYFPSENTFFVGQHPAPEFSCPNKIKDGRVHMTLNTWSPADTLDRPMGAQLHLQE